MHQLVLLRHGESTWNLENRCAGWTDVGLTPKGIAQARNAGRLLRAADCDFDLAYTSMLKRATHTLWHALDELDRSWLPVAHSWRLNQRHCGALQGLNPAEMAAQYGEAQVQSWRHSYDTPPPVLLASDPRCERLDLRYAKLKPGQVPLTESLKDTVERVLPFWSDSIAPALRAGKRVLVAAHGDSLRALVKCLDGLADEAIVDVNLARGIPLVYEMDNTFQPLRHYYLGDDRAVS